MKIRLNQQSHLSGKIKIFLGLAFIRKYNFRATSAEPPPPMGNRNRPIGPSTVPAGPIARRGGGGMILFLGLVLISAIFDSAHKIETIKQLKFNIIFTHEL